MQTYCSLICIATGFEGLPQGRGDRRKRNRNDGGTLALFSVSTTNSRPQLEPPKAVCAPNWHTCLSVELDQCTICPVSSHTGLLLKGAFAISDICAR